MTMKQGERGIIVASAPNFRIDFLKCWSKMPSGTLKNTKIKGEKWWTNMGVHFAESALLETYHVRAAQ